MTKRSRNRDFQENTIKKLNLVMTPNTCSDEFHILAWSLKCRYTESQLYL